MMYNIVHSLMIQRTSAVSTPVIGMLKVIAIVILSAIFLGERDVLTVSSTLTLPGMSVHHRQCLCCLQGKSANSGEDRVALACRSR